MNTVRALLAGALLGIAAVGSAAGATPLGASAYRSRANAICVKEQLATVTRFHAAANLGRYLTSEGPVLRGALASLSALDPAPPALAALQTRVLTTVRGEITLFSSLAARAKAGRLSESQWLNDANLEQLNARELALWQAIGATSCAAPG